MLFPPHLYPKVADGTVTLAFRRWKRANVKVGTRQRTEVGVIEVVAMSEVGLGAITDEEARRAGATGRDEVLRELAPYADGTLYRIELRYAGPDPRALLREQADLTDDEAMAVLARLARLDHVSKAGPWTAATLRLIAARPEVRAGDLAASVGREIAPFKLDVRKLKELGLTESLERGYRLSPRGAAILERLEATEAGLP